MKAEECRRFDDCSAPICPLDETKYKAIWYTDEEICVAQAQNQIPQVYAQRKLIRAKAEGYFTWDMLSRGCQIRKGIQGLDPDRPEEDQLERWMNAHPPCRELSDEERAVMRERFETNVLSKQKEASSIG